MGGLLFNVRKGIRRTLLIFKVLFLAKWMKMDDVLLIKQVFTEDILHSRPCFNASWQNETADKNLCSYWQRFLVREDKNNHLDKIYLMSDGHKFDGGNRKSRELG